MTGKIEEKVIYNIEKFVNFTNDINGLDYAFIGFFANIVYNHFRGCPFFEMAVSEDSLDKLINIAKNNGFEVINDSERLEIFSEEILFKIKLYSEEDLSDKVEICIDTDEYYVKMNFANKEFNRKILEQKETVYGKIDIDKVAKNELSSDIERLDYHLKLYFYFMYFSTEHDHRDGSESCRLCRKRRSRNL